MMFAGGIVITKESREIAYWVGEMYVRARRVMGPGNQKKAAFMCANKQEEGRPSLKLHGQDVPEFKYLGLTIQGN